MAWPASSVSVGDIVTASQLNLLPIQIADSTVSGSVASSIDFQNLPSQFAHLLVVVYGRGDNASTDTTVRARLNNDTGSAYKWQLGYFSGASTSASNSTSDTSFLCSDIPAASATANYFGATTIWIPHYANTSNFKEIATVWSQAGNLQAGVAGGIWLGSGAVIRLTLICGAGNFAIGSRATVYGLA